MSKRTAISELPIAGPLREDDRLAVLKRYHVLDSAPEQAYDDATLLASQVCNAPIALVTLVDSEREWFKSRVGVAQDQLPRYASFCGEAIKAPGDLMLVEDTYFDTRFDQNALVKSDPGVRFYAGAPLVTAEGLAIGTVCVMDYKARFLSGAHAECLRAIARQVMTQLEMRLVIADLRTTQDGMHRSHRILVERQSTLTAANAELHKQSKTDGLTGLFNRRAFDNFLATAVSDALIGASPLSLLMLDVDDFKGFNDVYGHPAGDDVLRTVSGIMQSSARKNDIVARYGGEEFVVLCPGATQEQALRLAARLREAVAGYAWRNRPITLSVGVASHETRSRTPEVLLQSADQALYHAKASGRNRVVAYAHLARATQALDRD